MNRSRLLVLAMAFSVGALLIVPFAGAVPPAVSITGGTSGVINTNSASFDFTVDDPDATVECDVGQGFSPCSSGVSYSSLSEGSHTFTVRATNLALEVNSDSVSFAVDTTGPSLSLPNVTKDVNDVASTTVTYSPSGSDPHGPVNVTCTPASGSTFSLGTVSVSCTGTDGLGNSSSGSFTVTVRDVTAPVITSPGNITDTVNGATSKVESFTVTANAGTPTCSPASGSSFPLGSTTVTCHSTDASSNVGTATFSVTISDNQLPTLTLPGNKTVQSPLGANVNVTYSVSGSDGGLSLTPSCSPASGSSFALGTTHVNCSVTDLASNTKTGSFDVIVVDTTAPTVSISGGPTGTVGSGDASFSFSANEGSTACAIDGGGFSACSSSASYSGLGDGAHTFQVKATDASNNSNTASRSWTVDLTPPTFSAPSGMTVEANGPDGAIVTYSVTAADNGVPLLPSAVNCSPASATKFPIGTTTVTCTAADTFGNTGTASFGVQVRDSTPPRIIAGDITVTATSPAGIKKTENPIASYIDSLRASDLVSNVVAVVADAPDVFPVGQTPLRLRAVDRAGNSARRTIVVTVLPVGRDAPPPPDLTPPADVTGLKVTTGDHTAALSWTPPVAKDLASIEVRMTESGGTVPTRVVSRGIRSSTSVVGLKNGVEYRFLVVSIDTAGNESRGAVVLAVPEAKLLVSPKAGTKVTSPPLLRWAPVPGATYYNVQLYVGKAKVLSAWPTRSQMKLARAWTYGSVKRKLAVGTYTWYVWPGFGARADVKYGKLRGKSSFVVVSPASNA